MKFASFFAGIGGLDLGLERAGMECVLQCEIDDQARSVLAKHWPDVDRMEDVTDVRGDDLRLRGVDLICGGFPCQDVSLAGRRAGLDGARSGLWFEYRRLIEEARPGWVVIENVPGLLSSNSGRDMGTVLRGLAELGYGYAFRVLDSRYFGVPQRRRRLFIVGCARDWAAPGEVLLEPEGVLGDLETSIASWPEPPEDAARGPRERGESGSTEDVVSGVAGPILGLSGRQGRRNDLDGTTYVPVGPGGEPLAGTLTTRYGKGVNTTVDDGALVVAYRKSRRAQSDKEPEQWVEDGEVNTLNTFDTGETRATSLVVLWPARRSQKTLVGRELRPDEPAPTITATEARQTDRGLRIVYEKNVRRLSPVECERLQGFPDDWTGGQSDTTRGRQLGNAVTVNVAHWIGSRIMDYERTH